MYTTHWVFINNIHRSGSVSGLKMTIPFIIYRLVLLSSLSCKLVSRSSTISLKTNDTKLGRGGARSCVLVINIVVYLFRFACLGIVQIGGV